jgi:hypothetical protein
MEDLEDRIELQTEIPPYEGVSKLMNTVIITEFSKEFYRQSERSVVYAGVNAHAPVLT